MNSTNVNGPGVGPPVPSVEELTLILKKTNGSLLMAGFISTMLYGLLLHQAYRYFRLYPKDTPFLKTLVVVVLAIETSYTVFNIHYCYHDFIVKYASLEPLFKVVWSGNLLPLVGIMTSFVTHIFFIRRVSLVGSGHKVLAYFAVVFHLAAMGLALEITIKAFIEDGDASVYLHGKRLIGFCLGSAILADLCITGGLVSVMYRGRRSRKRTGSPTLVDLIAIYVINTGLLVLLFDVVTLCMAMASSDDLYWAALNSITSRVYTNTLLSVLNSRQLHSTQEIEIFRDGPLHTISHANRLATMERWNVPEVPDPTPKTITINVSTEREDELSMSKINIQNSSEEFPAGGINKV